MSNILTSALIYENAVGLFYKDKPVSETLERNVKESTKLLSLVYDDPSLLVDIGKELGYEIKTSNYNLSKDTGNQDAIEFFDGYNISYVGLGIISAVIGAKGMNKVLKVAKTIKAVKVGKFLKVADDINSFYNASRKGNALKDDIHHRAASMLTKEQMMSGKIFEVTGKDNVKRELLQTVSELNGKKGIFEYILDTDGKIFYQVFKEGRVIDGKPN